MQQRELHGFFGAMDDVSGGWLRSQTPAPPYLRSDSFHEIFE